MLAKKHERETTKYLFSPTDQLVATTKRILESEDYNSAEEEIIVEMAKATYQFKNQCTIQLQYWFNKKLEEIEATKFVEDLKTWKNAKKVCNCAQLEAISMNVLVI